MSETPEEQVIGAVIAGCRLERLLGRGGMGTVYLARRRDGGAQVVKLLAPELSRTPALRARFLREADALRRLRPHPHVVRVHEVVADGEQPAIVMELVDGPSLARLLAERGPLPPAEAARLAREIALGLAALHAQGLVHRDVKPANVLLTAAGRAKVVDLGLAKDAFTSGLTEPGQVLGTLEYMAPEQWASGPVDARTDVFALGATLYALLTGRPPFTGQDAAELADQIAAGDVVAPSSLVSAIGPELERVVLRALDPEPDWRHASAEALAWDLERVARGERALVPGLTSLDGRLWLPLQPGRAFVLGSGGPGTTFAVQGAGVAPRHAQVRRKARGFAVAHLRADGSGGTWLSSSGAGEKRVDAPVDLRDGDVLRLGSGSSLSLRVEDPRERTPPPAWLREPSRRLVTEGVLEALVGLGDPRTTAALLERLAPDPLLDARVARTLEALAGPHAGAIAARRAQDLERERARLPGHLARVADQLPPNPDRPGDPSAWLAWWDGARTGASEQLGVEGRPLGLSLRARGGPALVLDGAPDIALLGRDPRCALRLEHPTVSRRHATVLRLHRRLVIRNDDPGLGTLHRGAPLDLAFLDPGDTLVLGAVEVTLTADDASWRPRPAQAGLEVDLSTFRALVAAGHPAAATGLVDILIDAERAPDALAATARALTPDATRADALLTELRGRLAAQARAARAALSALLGVDAGTAAEWVALLDARRAGLGPQAAVPPL